MTIVRKVLRNVRKAQLHLGTMNNNIFFFFFELRLLHQNTPKNLSAYCPVCFQADDTSDRRRPRPALRRKIAAPISILFWYVCLFEKLSIKKVTQQIAQDPALARRPLPYSSSAHFLLWISCRTKCKQLLGVFVTWIKIADEQNWLVGVHEVHSLNLISHSPCFFGSVKKTFAFSSVHVHPLPAFLSYFDVQPPQGDQKLNFEEDWIFIESVIILFCPSLQLYCLKCTLFFLLLQLVFRFLPQSKQPSFQFEFQSHRFSKILPILCTFSAQLI